MDVEEEFIVPDELEDDLFDLPSELADAMQPEWDE